MSVDSWGLAGGDSSSSEGWGAVSDVSDDAAMWQVGSLGRYYSKSNKEWFDCEITEIKAGGKICVVTFTANGQRRNSTTELSELKLPSSELVLGSQEMGSQEVAPPTPPRMGSYEPVEQKQKEELALCEQLDSQKLSSKEMTLKLSTESTAEVGECAQFGLNDRLWGRMDAKQRQKLNRYAQKMKTALDNTKKTERKFQKEQGKLFRKAESIGKPEIKEAFVQLVQAKMRYADLIGQLNNEDDFDFFRSADEESSKRINGQFIAWKRKYYKAKISAKKFADESASEEIAQAKADYEALVSGRSA